MNVQTSQLRVEFDSNVVNTTGEHRVGQCVNAHFERLTLLNDRAIRLQHLAVDPHDRRIDDLVHLLPRLDDLAGVYVGGGNDAVDRARDRHRTDRLAGRKHFVEHRGRKAQRKQLMRGDAALGCPPVVARLRFEQPPFRDAAQLGQARALFEQAAGQVELRGGLEQVQLQRLDFLALDAGQLLSLLDPVPWLHEDLGDPTRDKRGGKGMLPPGNFNRGIGHHVALERLQVHDGGRDAK